MQESNHFADMLTERSIPREWVDRAVVSPDKTEDREDGTRHYLKMIEEHGNRWLRVVVNIQATPQQGVTVFFDRRLKR
jgi:hypothetical protein